MENKEISQKNLCKTKLTSPNRFRHNQDGELSIFLITVSVFIITSPKSYYFDEWLRDTIGKKMCKLTSLASSLERIAAGRQELVTGLVSIFEDGGFFPLGLTTDSDDAGESEHDCWAWQRLLSVALWPCCAITLMLLCCWGDTWRCCGDCWYRPSTPCLFACLAGTRSPLSALRLAPRLDVFDVRDVSVLGNGSADGGCA